MSNNNEKVVSAVVEPSPLPYSALALARVEELRAMRDSIPHFVIPEAAATREMASAASVPPEFVALTTMAMTHQKTLSRGQSLTAEEIRDLMSYAEAFSPLADELEALAHFVRHSVRAARHKAGVETLTVYALARRLAKRRECAELVPHVADMRRALGRGRKPSAETLARRAAEKAAEGALKQTA
ncbi:MAG TPA: hypothetical protein VF618_25080 [Thermoanaerobaculia bacterium]